MTISDHVRRRASSLAGGLAIALIFSSASVFAADDSSAETLFQDARDLMGKGDFATACPKLEQAYALDHGAGTLLALAVCHEGQGKPATALREYRESLSIAVNANRPDRVMLAESHVQKLEASVPRIKIRTPSPEPAELVVSIDGAPVDRAAMIAGTPVDPGQHIVAANARGVAPWRQSVAVASPSSAIVVDVMPPEKIVVPPGGKSSGGGALRTTGWITVVAGVAAVGVGSVFGVAAFDAEKRSQSRCQNDVCSQDGVDLNQQARRDALISDVGFAAGGVALAVGVYFLLRTASRHATAARTAPLVRASSVGIGLSW